MLAFAKKAVKFLIVLTKFYNYSLEESVQQTQQTQNKAPAADQIQTGVFLNILDFDLKPV